MVSLPLPSTSSVVEESPEPDDEHAAAVMINRKEKINRIVLRM